MRVIKSAEYYIKTIAGEMLNIEASILYWLDGAAVDPAPSKDDIGYPKIVDRSIEFKFKATSGILFVPNDIDIHKLQNDLSNEISSMELKMKYNNGEQIKPLMDYHVINSSRLSDTKIKPNNSLVISDIIQPVRSMKNIKRFFTTKMFSMTTYITPRFIWLILPMKRINYKHNNIRDNVLSILYDPENVFTLDHNDIIYKPILSYIRNYDKILSDTILLSTHGDLLIELSPYWINRYTSIFTPRLKQVNNYNVINAAIEDFDILPVEIANGQYSNDVCVKCRTLLFDRIYIYKCDNSCMAVCILCLLYDSYDDIIYPDNQTIYEVIHPRTISDMITEEYISSPIRRDILFEIIKGITTYTMIVKNKTITYKLIGDKYLYCSDMNYIFYSTIFNHIILSRKVINIKIYK